MDSTALTTQDAKRRGVGWLAGHADAGWSNRVGWYEGMHLLVSIGEADVIIGYGYGPSSSHDLHL